MSATFSDVDPADFDVEFRAGFGRYLDAQVEAWSWSEGTAFAPGTVGIVDGGLPQSPADVLALASYTVTDDPTLSDSVLGLQVTTRTSGQDPRTTSRLTSTVFDLLHGLTHVVLPGGVYVVQSYRQSMAGLGPDESARLREVSNFYVTVHRPSRNRT